MTDNDDKLKQLFNDKHQEDEFSFDQENWKKLSSVLKAEKKNKKRLIIYLSVLVMFLALTGIYNLKRLDKSDNSFAQGEHNNSTLTDKKPESPLKTKNLASGFPKEKTVQYRGKPVQSFKKSANDVNITSARKTNDPDKKPSNQESDYKKQTTVSSTQDAEPLASNTRYNNHEEGRAILAIAGHNGSITSNTKYKDAENTMSEPVNADNQDSKIQKEEAADHIAAKENTDASQIISELPLPAIENLRATETQNELARSIAKLDSRVPLENLRTDSIPRMLIPTNVLSLEVGSTYLFGWKNNNKTEANGFNPVLGLNYSTIISPKIGLLVGVQFNSVKNITATSHTSATTRVKFGEESDVTVISAREMYYLVAPLKLTYSFNNRNVVSLGYNVGYLLDVKSDIKTYTKRLDYQSDPVVSTSMGYSTGFNAFDGQIAVGYRRRIYNELFINGEVFYGIKDIKNNLSYGSSVFERNYGFKLTLSCGLFKK